MEVCRVNGLIRKRGFYTKIILGSILLGFGVALATVFPKAVLSQTIPDDQTQLQFLPTPNPSDVNQLYLEWQLIQKAKKLVGKVGGQCVTFARNFTGAPPTDVGGVAKFVKTNTTTPEVGEIVKTDESPEGHLGVIISEDGDNLTIVDSNYDLDQIVRIRTINAQDPKILGYIKL